MDTPVKHDNENRPKGSRSLEHSHAGSDPDSVYCVYAMGKAAEESRTATGGIADDGSSTGNGGS